MAVQLSFPADLLNFSQETSLDGTSYRFKFVWNYREESWTMAILDTDLNPVVQGIKVVLNYELLAPYQAYEIPPGEFWAVDTTGELETIGKEDLGSTVQLVYLEEADLA